MEDIKPLVSSLASWFEEFSRALDNWEGWLGSVEQAYVTGEFERLQALESEAIPVQEDLGLARGRRAELIEAARKLGCNGNSLTSLVRWLGEEAPKGSTLRLARFEQQLRRVQQMSTALWVTGFQAASYTSALLEILATGNADRATYGTCERQALEGGQIVDAAA